jgi:hypothetical protein
MEVVKGASHKQSNRPVGKVDHAACGDKMLLCRHFSLVRVGPGVTLDYCHRSALPGMSFRRSSTRGKLILTSPFGLFSGEVRQGFFWPADEPSSDEQNSRDSKYGRIIHNSNWQINTRIAAATSLRVYSNGSSSNSSGNNSSYNSDENRVFNTFEKSGIGNTDRSQSNQLDKSTLNYRRLGDFIVMSGINFFVSSVRLASCHNKDQNNAFNSLIDSAISADKNRVNTTNNNRLSERKMFVEQTAATNKKYETGLATLSVQKLANQSSPAQPKLNAKLGLALNYKSEPKTLFDEDTSAEHHTLQFLSQRLQKHVKLGGMISSLLASPRIHTSEINRNSSSTRESGPNKVRFENHKKIDGEAKPSVISPTDRTGVHRQLIVNKQNRLATTFKTSLSALNKVQRHFGQSSIIERHSEFSPLASIILEKRPDGNAANLLLKNKQQQIAKANSAMNELCENQHFNAAGKRKYHSGKSDGQEGNDQPISEALLKQLKQQFHELQLANSHDSKALIQAMRHLTEALGPVLMKKSLASTTTMRPLNFLGPL